MLKLTAFRPLSLLAALALLAACGGAEPAAPAATEPAAVATLAPAPAEPSVAAAVEPSVAAAAEAPAAAEAAAEGPFAGIPQGRTPEGYHMLGAADAPVTLVMYSDFL